MYFRSFRHSCVIHKIASMTHKYTLLLYISACLLAKWSQSRWAGEHIFLSPSTHIQQKKLTLCHHHQDVKECGGHQTHSGLKCLKESSTVASFLFQPNCTVIINSGRLSLYIPSMWHIYYSKTLNSGFSGEKWIWTLTWGES